MPTFSDALTYGDAPAYGAWPVPAQTLADVWQGFPAWWTDADDPIRDALGAGLRRLWLDIASAAARSAPAHLRAHATGWALDLVARGVGLARAEAERDAMLRARIATVSDADTVPALQAAYDATTAPLTTQRVRIILPWAHALYAGRGFLGRRPIDAASTDAAGGTPFVGGVQILYDVGSVRYWSPGAGRFGLVVPRLTATFGLVASRWSGPDPVPPGMLTAANDPARASFFGRVVTGNRAFLNQRSASLAVYRTIALATERLRAAGIRWIAFLDPTT